MTDADLYCCLAQGLGPSVLTPSRVNGFANMLEAVRRRTRMLTSDLPTFPSLLITQEGITAQVGLALMSKHHWSLCWVTNKDLDTLKM